MNIGEYLTQAWSEARAGKGQFIHLVGTVGCGKSTHLARFLESVDQSDQSSAVVSFRCGDQTLIRSTEHGEIEGLVARISEGVRVIDWSSDGEDETGQVQWVLPGTDFLASANRIAALPAGSESPTRASIHAGLLLDICQNQPILLVLDDVHRTDASSLRLVEELAARLRKDQSVSLLLVAVTTEQLVDADGQSTPWRPDPSSVVEIPALPQVEVEEFVRSSLNAWNQGDEKLITLIADVAQGNPLVAHALSSLATQPAIVNRAATPLVSFDEQPQFFGLKSIANGVFPRLRADTMADLQTAAVVGRRFDVALMSQLWSVPEEAALIRIDGILASGFVVATGDQFSFHSDELASQCADLMDEDVRQALHARLASILRSLVSGHSEKATTAANYLDVTDTWLDTKRRDKRLGKELEMLWSAAQHYAAAGRHLQSAESAVTFVERLFDMSGGHPFLAGRFGRRADRERRHRIYAALTEASAQIEVADAVRVGRSTDSELTEVRVRILTVRSRFKEVMGDFAEARRTADMSVQLSRQLVSPVARLGAQQVQLEVYYASGDANAARDALVRILADLESIKAEHTISVYVWLAEAIARWEWSGLHSRLFPFLFERLRKLGANREALKVSLEWLRSTAQSGDAAAVDILAERILSDAGEMDEDAYLAEQLARCAADLIQMRVEMHYDLLSGEFYVPDLYGTDQGPRMKPLGETIGLPVELIKLAAQLSKTDKLRSGSDDIHLIRDAAQRKRPGRLTELRVATTTLGIIYETRERLAELLNHWMPIHSESQPVRLSELVDLLNNDFFGVAHVEHLTEKIVVLSEEMSLDQVLADTIYEALDRQLPGAVQRAGTLVGMARDGYERVGDAYGLITLALVETRHFDAIGRNPDKAIDQGLKVFEDGRDQLTPEQEAFVHLQFGELLLDLEDRFDEALTHLESALGLYDRIGDVDHLQITGAILREVYRKQGDLARYRWIRERFRAINDNTPGFDPLGLELRIEQLLSMARQESDDERAIQMVEQCVQLFGRMPDGTTRIDECFVEISKICRRRADEAENEQSFLAWLERSLEAVRVAASINRSLGNYFRLFEEIHELFDDLLGLGLYDEYVRVRAENRELAFAVGNISELLYLFEEHLQYDAETGSPVARLSEVRGFYEALVRYLLGVGAADYAIGVQTSFVGFLTAIGEQALAEQYRNRSMSL